jgi:GPH family glycoside/pentoside/hexuronide:cation symporter
MSLSEKNQMAIEEKPLKLKDTILYNMAAFSLNVYDTILATWLLFFFVPPEDLGHVRYIPMVVLATIMAGGRILDAITDPLIGYMSDHTGSRWGRRKPYIFISSPILFLTFILVWLPPVNSTSNINALFLGVVLFVYYWAYTGVLIPWFAVLPELSKENRGRVKIATIGVAIGVIGALVGGGLSGPLLEKFGAFKMAVILGATAFIACELTLFGIKERHPVQSIKGSAGFGGFLQVLKQVFSDKQVLCFSITIMLVQLTYQLMLMNVPYFTTLILKQEESMASYLYHRLVHAHVVLAVEQVSQAQCFSRDYAHHDVRLCPCFFCWPNSHTSCDSPDHCYTCHRIHTHGRDVYGGIRTDCRSDGLR